MSLKEKIKKIVDLTKEKIDPEIFLGKWALCFLFYVYIKCCNYVNIHGEVYTQKMQNETFSRLP